MAEKLQSHGTHRQSAMGRGVGKTIYYILRERIARGKFARLHRRLAMVEPQWRGYIKLRGRRKKGGVDP